MLNCLSGKIVVIGFGNMGKALVRGLQCRNQNIEIYVCDRFELNPNEDYPRDIDFNKLTYLSYNDLKNVKSNLRLSEKDSVIFCVKPQNFLEAVERWKPILLGGESHPLVISILAGVPTELIHKYFSNDCPVIRCMPNIASTVDCSASALCASKRTSNNYLDRAKHIFDSVGKTWVVNEDQLDAVTGLSGSGPAYIYMIIEALSDGGVKMGLSRQLSLELATQTVLGAAKLVQETRLHPAVLRDQVTTPGGTTISAIHELEKHGLRPMLISAVVTATEKSASLAQLVERKIIKSNSDTFKE
ncbi:pyrroline-5-carboxylate reductase [Fluviispira multicolorata]|uniref:Pyrroline-5-carboxylate reductase n=1 Tax=Fluviispira multicolorata TaxID=2654512 RepID=A0A833JCA4_9BACT|nr:pyrroline-5-carboxylate reductase [Fluviispira multicolorata]KAB8029710.1 pyrroline-5-carboxylate reductase [Fluviispira multicolorata]